MQNPILFAHIVAISSLVTYLLVDPVNEGKRLASPSRRDGRWLLWVLLRSAAAAVLTFWISAESVPLATTVFVACLGLPYLRRYLIPNSYGAELEVVAVAIFLCFTYALTPPYPPAIHAPFTADQSKIVAILLIVSIVFAMLRGGTYAVRGILRRTESLPKKGIGDSTLDEKEINRGRIIGHLERIILMIVVAKGSYEALGFLIAAKGLIRSEHFSDRDWAEYFLIGSLASVLIALVAGWTVAVILRTYWI